MCLHAGNQIVKCTFGEHAVSISRKNPACYRAEPSRVDHAAGKIQLPSPKPAVATLALCI